MRLKGIAMALATIPLAACVSTPEPKDYSSFHAEAPRSILVVPVVNHSNEVEASNLFLTTMAMPLAEKGFYVFPTHAVRTLMEAEGLGDPGLVHTTQTSQLGSVFGADAVLYVEILNWKSGYNVLSSDVEVEFIYTLKSAKTDAVLWQDQQNYVHSFSANSGNIFADLIANAVKAAIDSTRSDFTPVAMQANVSVLSPAGVGMPFGPYSPNVKQNQKLYPSTGSGVISDSSIEAMSAPGVIGSPDEAE